MKNLLVFFVMMISYTCAFCSQNRNFEQSEKIYVQPDQISITKEGIFVFLENSWFQAETIHSDPSGVYVKDDYNVFTWKCRYCGWVNPWWVNACESCKKR